VKKILILGGSHRDIPLIKAAQDLGYFVATLGDRDYYLGHSYADKFFRVNFHDFDKIKEIYKKEKIDYIIPGSGEQAYLNAVVLSKELNICAFDEIDTAKLIHNKWKFKEFCVKNKIPTPKGQFFDKSFDSKKINFPLIVKPTILSGGRGVSIARDEEQLHDSILNASKNDSEIVIEEFIEGSLVAYSVFLKESKVLFGFLGKDESYKNKYLITTAYPICIKKCVENKIRSYVEKIARELSLVDGMFHLQIIIRDEIPYFIDVTRRIPGDLYPNLIELCNGVDYSKAVIKSYIGLEINDEFINQEDKFYVRHCVMSPKNGLLEDIYIDEKISKNIALRIDLIEFGAVIDNFLTDQIAIIIFEYSAKKIKDLRKIDQMIRVIIKD